MRRGAGECQQGRRWRPVQSLRVRLKRFKEPANAVTMPLAIDKTCDLVSLERSDRPALGGAPSPEEVEAAAHELLTIHNERPGTDDSLRLIRRDILCQQENPPADNAVAQCLHLFHQNVHVQETVKSLAKDPAVWDAFVKNEKVQELMQRRQTSLPSASAVSHAEEHLNPFVSAFNSVATVMREVMGAFLDLTHLLLKVVNRGISSPTMEAQQPFKACMLLTILILALVLLHRLP